MLTSPAYQNIQTNCQSGLFFCNPAFFSVTREVPDMQQQLLCTPCKFYTILMLYLGYACEGNRGLNLSDQRGYRLWSSFSMLSWLSCFPIGSVIIILVQFGGVGCHTLLPEYTFSEWKDGILSLEKSLRPGQCSCLVALAIPHIRYWPTEVPWCLFFFLHWCTGSSGLYSQLLTSDALYLGVLKRNVVMPKVSCRYSPLHLHEFS